MNGSGAAHSAIVKRARGAIPAPSRFPSPGCRALSDAAIPRYRPPDRNHGALRRPGTGCGWNIEQTFETIVPYTIKEAYEIADAVARGNMRDFKEELGDLLLQDVFQALIAEERGLFDFGGGSRRSRKK